MDILTANPKLLKQANLSLIRKVMKSKASVTRAEIAFETQISSTTVRTLLAEMLQNGEIESIGYDESSGGRKAERYHFNSDRFCSAVFCITDERIYYLLVNVCGEILETSPLDVTNGNYEACILSCLDALTLQRDIKSIGIGAPGVVDGGSFWCMRKKDNGWYQVDIGNTLTKRYGIPVVMENDINATAIGFGRCYEREFPAESPETMNMAYVHFEKGCISAGFIAGGKIVRGSHNFAGELGLIPIDNDTLLHETITEQLTNHQFIEIIIKIICWICGILNPQYIALGGQDLLKECIAPINDGLSALLPKHMSAEILYSPDVQHDYFEGMSYLTTSKMFYDIQFTRE